MLKGIGKNSKTKEKKSLKLNEISNATIEKRLEKYAETFRNKDWMKNILLLLLFNSDINKVKRIVSLITISVEEREKLNKAVEEIFSKVNSKNPIEGRTMWTVFEELGIKKEEIIDELLNMLGNTNEEVGKATVSVLVKIAKKNGIEEEIANKLLKRINSKSSIEREMVCYALGELGIASKKVIEGLMNMLGYMWIEAGDALVKIAKKNGIEEEIAKKLVSEINTPYKKLGVCLALGKLGFKDIIVINALLDRLEDEIEAPSVKKIVAWALGELGVKNRRVISALVKRLKDKNEKWEVKEASAEALGKLGIKSKKAIRILIRGLRNINPRIRKAYADALVKIAKKNGIEEEIANKLLKRINSKSSIEREMVCYALGELGIASKKVIESLMKMKKDKNKDVGEAAKEALSKITKYSEEK